MTYARYAAAIRGEPLPAALVDLDALERNVDVLVTPVRARAKTVRIATKSLRSIDLLRRVVARGGDAVRGVMAFSPAEAAWLVEEGFDDVLVAYPTALAADAALVAQANRRARVALAIDDPRHVAVAAAAGREAGVAVPLVVDLDVSYRPFGARVHVGVRRSPLREPGEIAELVELVRGREGVAFAGLLAYEAHVAGVDDRGARAAMKRLARPAALAQRRAILDELARRRIEVPLFDGGGTGSAAWSASDPSLTEVAIGSGFLDSHLFDAYDDLALSPAAFFALQITRRPAPDLVTCQSGGFVASGAAGPDRLPLPWLPEGLSLTRMEGAGEVQTPLRVPAGVHLELGDPVFFRHAKAGELAERVASYLLVRGDRVEGRAATYRGDGRCFG